jgi:molybdenum cofactor cytidylyltransferase
MDVSCEKLAGILLAAGSSTRMGRLKQLLPLGGKTLIERTLEQTLASELNKIVLVLGHRAEEVDKSLPAALKVPRLSIVNNVHYMRGMSSSIIAGLSAVEKSHDHIMILLADMPGVDSRSINHLIRQYLLSGLPLGAVKVGKRRSHPVILSRSFYGALHKLRGDVGAKGIFEANAGRVCLVEPDSRYDDGDIDTRQDYLSLKTALEKPSLR